MTHFAIVTQPLRGHLDPLNALGQELVRRGHRVSVFIELGAATMVGDGLSLEPMVVPPLNPTHQVGSGGRLGSILAMAWRTHHLCAGLPDALRRAGVEAVIADQTEAAGALAARHLALPYASVACALPLNREDSVPPPFVDWPAGMDAQSIRRNRAGYRICDLLMTPVSAVVRRQARRFGLHGILRLEDTFSPTLQLFQIVEALDFPRRALPDTAHYVGPLRPAPRGDFAPARDGRPLAFCSLGTLQGGRARLFADFARVVHDAGCRALIAHGGRLSAKQVQALPGGPLAFDFVPQRAVLQRAAFALVHGGMNTVLDALAAGVPLVVVPLAHEQGAIAARVEASGAGLMVRPGRVSRDLAGAVARILGEPSFRLQARRMAAAIAGVGKSASGVRLAADLVEQRLCAGAPHRAAAGAWPSPRAAGEASEPLSVQHVDTGTSDMGTSPALRPLTR
jgi:zeaxanthin glucosyltransferase